MFEGMIKIIIAIGLILLMTVISVALKTDITQTKLNCLIIFVIVYGMKFDKEQ
jgi:hypothetical protein